MFVNTNLQLINISPRTSGNRNFTVGRLVDEERTYSQMVSLINHSLTHTAKLRLFELR